MKPHEWALRTESFGHVGCENVWYCKHCNCEGGFSNYQPDEKPGKPTHGDMELPEDCYVSQAMIHGYEIGAQAGFHDRIREEAYLNATRPFSKRLSYLLTRKLR